VPYSIIIPVFNEEKTLENLLKEIKIYQKEGNEILIVNDGSIDNTGLILNKYKYVENIHLRRNYGKGIAIKIGLLHSKYDKTIIFDGDLELKTSDIEKLMLLSEHDKIKSVFGFRFNSLSPFKSGFDWGNFIFTTFFNLLFNSSYKDILCCAKAFYKSNIPIDKIRSKSFDIDIELLAMIDTLNCNKNQQISLTYSRRSIEQGKKLKISDGWLILLRILKIYQYK